MFAFCSLVDSAFRHARALGERLDTKKKAATSSASGVSAARAMFQGAASRGISVKDNAVGASVSVDTRHQNAITGLFAFGNAAGKRVTNFTTCGADGRVLLWDLAKLDLGLAALKLA